MDETTKRVIYGEVRERLAALLEGEDDFIAAQATVVCELHHAFDYFDWTGFYRTHGADLLVIGPYQGGHGCLRIPFSRGVCGAAARSKQTQRVADVSQFEGHIACSSDTQSEIVVPLVAPSGNVLGVLDVDSNNPAAFSALDQPSSRHCAPSWPPALRDTSATDPPQGEVLLNEGPRVCERQGATKWLSDDRENSVLSKEDTEPLFEVARRVRFLVQTGGR